MVNCKTNAMKTSKVFLSKINILLLSKKKKIKRFPINCFSQLFGASPSWCHWHMMGPLDNLTVTPDSGWAFKEDFQE